MSLADFQDAITNAIFSQTDKEIDVSAIPYFVNREHISKALVVYREQAFASLAAILREVYPTVAVVMGEAQFQTLSKAFFVDAIPRAIDPILIAEPFARYLEALTEDKRRPHLADLATLDYGCFRAKQAIDAITLNANIFTDLAAEQLAVRRIQLHPACFWMSSEYAIYDVWKYHHTAFASKPDTLQTAQEIMIIRPKMLVEVHKVDIGMLKMLDLIDAGETLNTALTEAARTKSDFNPMRAIQFLVQNDLIVSFY